MTFEEAIGRLQSALGQPLPGEKAHAVMAPRPRRERPKDFEPARIRHAAGLLLLFPDVDARVVLTLRSDTLERHGGQVSLPGGVAEPEETFEQAALREAHEEVGLAPDQVRVLGRLTPLDIPVSGFRLHPIVGTIDRRPALQPAHGEVARILDVPLAELFARSTRGSFILRRDDHDVVVPAFRIAGVEIWGATAMVLAEFLSLLGWTP
jgi:8-oxo-dGTP pyrophosphatase MutT (NUDIX family)